MTRTNELWAFGKKSIILLCLFLTLIISCELPTEPKPPIAKINASTTYGILPLTVTFTDGSTGDVTSRKWYFHNGQTSSSSQVSFNYTNAGTYTVRLTVEGSGGSDTDICTIQVIKDATLSDLKATIDNSSKKVTLTVDVNFKGFAEQPKVLGVFWLKSYGNDFRYVKASGSTNVPDNYLGRLIELNPTCKDCNFNDVGYTFPYSLFPDRSSGTIYYGMAKVFDRIDINAVTHVNNPILAYLGPPEKIVRIVWQ